MAYHARRGNPDQIIEDLVELGICEAKIVDIFVVETNGDQLIYSYGILVGCG